MKTDEEFQKALSTAVTGCVKAESIEELRYRQGQVNIIEWYFEQTPDAFTDEEKKVE